MECPGFVHRTSKGIGMVVTLLMRKESVQRFNRVKRILEGASDFIERTASLPVEEMARVLS
jgi:hypothetical protein